MQVVNINILMFIAMQWFIIFDNEFLIFILCMNLELYSWFYSLNDHYNGY